MQIKISVCIIIKNESENLKRLLPRLSFADEIVIVDSGSTDDSLEIAKTFQAKIFHREFDNYTNQKNHAKSLSRNEWVLALDADEIPSSELVEEIKLLTYDTIANVSGFSIPRKALYLGQWIKHSGWYPNRQIRLFQKSKGKFSGLYVHEKVQLEGNLGKLKNDLEHYTYKSISHHLQFIDKYSTLFALEKIKKGKRNGIFTALWRGAWKFFWMYVIRFGFLDGKAGVVIATLGMYYNFLKYLKVYEFSKNPKLLSSFFVVVDPVHDGKSEIATQKHGDQVHVG